SLSEYNKYQVSLIGTLAKTLGKVRSSNSYIAQSFCLTNKATQSFFSLPSISSLIEEELSSLTLLQTQKIKSASKKIQDNILDADIPHDLALDIVRRYSKFKSQALIQTRLSEINNELPIEVLVQDSDHPRRTSGDANLLHLIKQEWARLYSESAIMYRMRHRLEITHAHVAIIVEQVPKIAFSGITQTQNVDPQHKNQILIESVEGALDDVMDGRMDSDVYKVDKVNWEIVESTLSKRKYWIDVSKGTQRKKY